MPHALRPPCHGKAPNPENPKLRSLFPQRARKNAMGFNHVVTLQDLDYPSAQRIQELQAMLDRSGARCSLGCGALTALPVGCGACVPWKPTRSLSLTHSPTTS